MFLYTELFGPQESLLSANFEMEVLSMDYLLFKKGDLRLRGAVRVTGISLFTFYPSILGGFHYIGGDEHKIDLGINILYQILNEKYVMNTGTSMSFNIGYRHNVNDNFFVGFAICPTYGITNKPFYPVCMKLGFPL
jgi:hypothetical protein